MYDVRFVRKAYLRLRQLHLAANHVMLAFRVEDPANPDQQIEGSCHDEESHGDVTLAQVLENTQMKNTAVFVVRYYGGTPLRALRLKMIADTARAALHTLRFPDSEDTSREDTHWLDKDNNQPLSQAEQSSTSPKTTHSSTQPDHLYGQSSPQLSSGRGGMSTSVGRGLKPFQQNPKKQKLDFETAPAFSIEY